MSKGLTRTHSLRKHIRPIIDFEEDDDDQRRDSFGRKRVDVVECLLDSSSDEIDNDENINIDKSNHILWLTFDEICHIRYVLTQTNLNLDKQYSQIDHGYICFRCRKKMNHLFFLPSFLRFNNHEICFICQQIICKKCSYFHFLPPNSKISIPIRIQTLIKPLSISIENKKDKINKSNIQTKTICYDCLQIFNEPIKTSKHPISPLCRTFSLPPIARKNFNEVRHTRHRPLPKLKKQQ